MPKFTYPIVFILNPDTNWYNGYVPDLAVFSEGEKLEDVYAEAEELMLAYLTLATKYDAEIPTPSSLEEVSTKWAGYKVSLVSAATNDQQKKSKKA